MYRLMCGTSMIKLVHLDEGSAGEGASGRDPRRLRLPLLDDLGVEHRGGHGGRRGGRVQGRGAGARAPPRGDHRDRRGPGRQLGRVPPASDDADVRRLVGDRRGCAVRCSLLWASTSGSVRIWHDGTRRSFARRGDDAGDDGSRRPSPIRRRRAAASDGFPWIIETLLLARCCSALVVLVAFAAAGVVHLDVAPAADEEKPPLAVLPDVADVITDDADAQLGGARERQSAQCDRRVLGAARGCRRVRRARSEPGGDLCRAHGARAVDVPGGARGDRGPRPPLPRGAVLRRTSSARSSATAQSPRSDDCTPTSQRGDPTPTAAVRTSR